MSIPPGAASVLNATRVPVTRGVGETLTGDYRRVVLKRFFPSTTKIAERIARHVLELDDKSAADILHSTMSRFRERHVGLEGLFCDRATEVIRTLNKEPKIPDEVKQMANQVSGPRRPLLGSVFLHEYAVEAAALFNPSIVPHPLQPEADGKSHRRRVVISLRSCGEGHISSISFREGTLTEDGRVVLDDNVTKNLHTGKVKTVPKEGCDACEVCETYRNPVTGHEFAVNNGPYTVEFDDSTPISGRVLFPQTPEQSNGIEDARFVRFVDEGRATYYGTLTAYDGKSILPQLVATPDFKSFTFQTITGDIVNKGMALFPRKVNGLYWMLSRQDDESIMIMKSDNILHWGNPQKLVEPKYAWEWFKMGNCGSPIETSFGWIVLTHGVGPLRRYSIGIVVLDLNDPTKVLGRLVSPVIDPTENEREGYVPNVVYTCGAMVHNDELMIPYAISDSRTTFATIHLNDIAAAAGLSAASKL